MGISSNQARLMTLTARQHDLELRAQQISAQKMIKGLESQEAAMEYSRALQNYSTLKQIEALPADKEYGAVINNGVISFREITPDEEDDFPNWGSGGSGLLFEISESELVQHVDSITANQLAGLELDEKGGVDEFLQIMKAQYERFTASVSAEEKLLDMELTQINTEHSAVKTEYDSVKGLVGENVDKSFNVFS